MGKTYDPELKAAFLAAVKEKLAEGWSVCRAYLQVRADFEAEGKEVPGQNACYRWLIPASPDGARITNLRKMIRRRGLTYREVAIRMGIPTKSVSSAARNGINTIGLAQRYAAALGCPFCQVMGKGRDYGCK